MKILISFCNTINDLQYFQNKGLSHLCILDTNTSTLIFITTLNLKDVHGFTGTSFDKEYLYAVSPTKKGVAIIKINKRNLKIVASKQSKECLDPHSILINNNRLYICSTGTNSIETYDIHSLKYLGKYWQFPDSSNNKDDVHLNSISMQNNNIWVSCTGKKYKNDWSKSKKGFLINTTSNEIKYSINHPHSLNIRGNDFYYCESNMGRICKNNNEVLKIGQAYIRGFDLNDEFFVTGLSSSRMVSKSTGRINNPMGKGKFVSKTGILVYNRAKKTKEYYDLSFYTKEIYDVKILDDYVGHIGFKFNGLVKIRNSGIIRENLLLAEVIQRKEDAERRVIILEKQLAKIKHNPLIVFYFFLKQMLKIK